MPWLQDVMPSGEERTRYGRELADFIDGRKRLAGQSSGQANRETIDANNEKHANLRTFRNRLALVTAALALCWWRWPPGTRPTQTSSRSAAAPAGATPAGSESSAATRAVRRFITGSEPRPADVAEIGGSNLSRAGSRHYAGPDLSRRQTGH
jgi:hypothetical protein